MEVKRSLSCNGIGWRRYTVGTLVGLALVAGGVVSNAANYYVATNGNDAAAGTLAQPFATIQRAANAMQPGDTCHIRGGRYHEQIGLTNKVGTSANRFTFKNYTNEQVIIDGTVPITSPWSAETLNGHPVYTTAVARPIWQLFVSNRMQVVARWPNVTVGHPCDPIQFKADGYTPVKNSWWDIGTWGQMLSSWNAGGNLTNNEAVHSLTAEGVSFAGGSIVLNFHSESQFSRNILSHTAGSSVLVHEPVVNPHDKGSGPFLIEALNALDIPGEWYYVTNTGRVYLMPEDGQNPTGKDIRGKTISYGLTMSGCQYVNLHGIDFFACTINSQNGKYITIDKCNFSYPTWFRRMLGEHTYNVVNGESRTEPPGEGTTFLKGDKNGTYYTVSNCVFKYSDGMVYLENGLGNVVENCLFHHWSFTGMSSFILNMNSSPDSVQRRCTFHSNGSKVMSKHSRADVEYCRAYYFGYFQQDGTAWQCAGGNGPGGPSDGLRRHHNWHHQAFKTGARWDGNDGVNGWNDHFVSWNTPSSLMVKGDYHQTHNNTAIFSQDPTDNMIRVLDNDGGNPPQVRNAHSHTYNNLADSISAARSGYVPLNGIALSNWNGYLHPDPADTADRQLRDPANLDFRPRADSDLVDNGVVVAGVNDNYVGRAPDIGAYEYGDTHYWIPGYQTLAASTPVPPDGSTTVRTNADLMWLEGRDAITNKIYFGTNSGGLAFMGNQAKSNNIFSPGPLAVGVTYYWRIDSVTATGTVAGTEWSFVPANEVITVFQVFNPVADTYARYASQTDYTRVNYGTDDKIGIASYSDGSIIKIGFMKFDINVTGTVMSATLKLHNSSGGTVNNLGIYTMTNTSWNELTLTWSNKPAIDGALLDTKDIQGGGNWSAFAVSAGVTKTGLVSFGLKKTVFGSGQRSVDSRESQWPPELVVEYAPQTDLPPAAPRNLIATGGARQIALDWDDNTEPDLAGYRVYRTDYLDDELVEITTSLLTSSRYVDSNVVGGVTYYYKVRAEDAAGHLSAGSITTQAQVLAHPVLGITVTNGMAVVNWLPVTGTLQSAPGVGGPWSNVGTNSPRMEPVGLGSRFYRVAQ